MPLSAAGQQVILGSAETRPGRRGVSADLRSQGQMTAQRPEEGGQENAHRDTQQAKKVQMRTRYNRNTPW